MIRLLPLLLLFAFCLPVSAQREELIGAWEHLDTTDPDLPLLGRAHFLDDGTFVLDLSANMGRAAVLDLDEAEDGTEPDPFTAALIQAFPDSLAVAVQLTGVWSAEGQALHLDAQTSEVALNGLPMQEFFDEVARRMATVLAEALGIPEEEYPAFEEQVMAQITAGGQDTFAEEFSPDESDLDGTYALAGGVLFITDEEGETTDWHRSSVSAVAATSWGQLKMARP